MKKALLKLSALSAGIALLAGCATTTKQQINIYQHESPQVIYGAGKNFLQKSEYRSAITAFNELNGQYPFNPYAQKGSLGLIYAYFKSGQKALALALAERYIKMYPTDQTTAYAYYIEGVVDFDNGRGFLQRRLPYQVSEHSPISYEAAYHSFNTLIHQYPKSRYTKDAKRRMVYLNQEMAKYEVHIARFYLEHKAYVAAANRAAEILKHYTNSTELKPALLIMLQSYHYLGLTDLESKTLRLLEANYPTDKSFLKIKAALNSQ